MVEKQQFEFPIQRWQGDLFREPRVSIGYNAGKLRAGYVNVPEVGKHAKEGPDVHNWGDADRTHDYCSHGVPKRPEDPGYDLPVQIHRAIHKLQSVDPTRCRVVVKAGALATTTAKTAHVPFEVGVPPIGRIHSHQSEHPHIREQQRLILPNRSRPPFHHLGRKR